MVSNASTGIIKLGQNVIMRIIISRNACYHFFKKLSAYEFKENKAFFCMAEKTAASYSEDK